MQENKGDVMGNPSDPEYQTDELLKSAVGNPTVEEWADWIVHRYNFCELNAGESLREIALVALRNIESRYKSKEKA
jgi:hypothetical protein